MLSTIVSILFKGKNIIDGLPLKQYHYFKDVTNMDFFYRLQEIS